MSAASYFLISVCVNETVFQDEEPCNRQGRIIPGDNKKSTRTFNSFSNIFSPAHTAVQNATTLSSHESSSSPAPPSPFSMPAEPTPASTHTRSPTPSSNLLPDYVKLQQVINETLHSQLPKNFCKKTVMVLNPDGSVSRTTTTIEIPMNEIYEQREEVLIPPARFFPVRIAAIVVGMIFVVIRFYRMMCRK